MNSLYFLSARTNNDVFSIFIDSFINGRKVKERFLRKQKSIEKLIVEIIGIKKEERKVKELNEIGWLCREKR